MIINPILKEKYDSQKRLNKKANNDLRAYFKNSHRNVSEMAEKYGLQLKFTEKRGGVFETNKRRFGEKYLIIQVVRKFWA